MPRFDMGGRNCLDCYMMIEPHPAGSAIGRLAETTISETMTDLFGRRFTYVGLAPRRHNGRYDLDSLRPGEFIVEPGLLYRLDDPRPRRKRPSREDALSRRSGAAPLEEHRNVGREIGLAVLFWVGGAVAVHLLFLAFGAG